MDALSHAWSGDQLYNGHPSTAIRSTTGAGKCGAENLRPTVTRGVLIDLVASEQRTLGPHEAVGPDALARALAGSSTALRPGDAVLIRTGWEEMVRDDPEAYFESEPGISVEAALWLAQQDIVLVGADNYAVEVQPSPPGTGFPAHQVLIRDFGVPLIEGMVLAELAAAGRPEFLLICVPNGVVGGTAAQVCPLAILLAAREEFSHAEHVHPGHGGSASRVRRSGPVHRPRHGRESHQGARLCELSRRCGDRRPVGGLLVRALAGSGRPG
jgi:kynurenine formamidase